jgi:multiple sugar transport system substrate-binding protein/raffinose/stachyose/melibiose transport system substrate-binding protein
MFGLTRRALLASALAATALALPTAPAFADGEVTISHYFTGDLGLAGIHEILDQFQKESGITVKDSPIGHEDFKAGILVRAAGGNLPDVFSYWAGARTQFVVDSGNLHPIDEMWKAADFDNIITKAIADGATMYDGKRYLVPFGYHYEGLFYNKHVMEKAGITEMPKTWDEFKAMCDKLKAAGITPIALGSKNRWPAQLWFDYLMLRTAGPDYRAALMSGAASYTDPQVVKVMELWKELVDAGDFTPNANADDWTDAADKVARGEAAMTLMGTWITGYWNLAKLTPGTDYELFEFPTLDAGVPKMALVPADGLVIAANAKNIAGAEKLIEFMAGNPEAQAKWASVQGALSANVKVDPKGYNVVMQHALDVVQHAEGTASNYDLATPPPVAEVGLSMFAEFMDKPADYKALLEKTQAGAADAFKQ